MPKKSPKRAPAKPPLPPRPTARPQFNRPQGLRPDKAARRAAPRR